MFFEFLMCISRLKSRTFISRVKEQHNMRNEENIGHIVRDKCMITSSLPTYKMSLLSANSSFLREKRDTFATSKIRIKWAIKGI